MSMKKYIAMVSKSINDNDLFFLLTSFT